MITGIYVFINKTNEKKYVGQSVDCKRRYSEHRRSSDPKKYRNSNKRNENMPIHKAF